MSNVNHMGGTLPHILLDDYIKRYKLWMEQRPPNAMGWKECAYGYTIAMIDDISFLIQQCDYDLKTTLIFHLKAQAPTLWTKVQESLASADSLTT